MSYECKITGCGNIEIWSKADQCHTWPGLCDWCHTYAHKFDEEFRKRKAATAEPERGTR